MCVCVCVCVYSRVEVRVLLCVCVCVADTEAPSCDDIWGSQGSCQEESPEAAGSGNWQTASKQRANAHVLAFKGSGNSFHWNKGSYSEG